MNEDEIVARLKQNIPQEEVPTLAPKPELDTSYGQATVAPVYELDEMVQYKLHDYFGQQYQPNDEVNRQQLGFIYEHVAGLIDSPEYGFVVAKIRDLENIIGTANKDDRIYRLYQWLKLDGIRRNTEAEMGALQNG